MLLIRNSFIFEWRDPLMLSTYGRPRAGPFCMRASTASSIASWALTSRWSHQTLNSSYTQLPIPLREYRVWTKPPQQTLIAKWPETLRRHPLRGRDDGQSFGDGGFEVVAGEVLGDVVQLAEQGLGGADDVGVEAVAGLAGQGLQGLVHRQ